MTIHSGNYCRTKLSRLVVENGDTIRNSNLLQVTPNMPICEGKTGLIFEDCLLVNVTLPPDAVVIGAPPRNVSFCSHLHPTFELTPCVENCPHVTEVDTVTIDGVVVDTIYHREDTIL